ncbi:e7bc8fef-8f9e-4cbb-927b-431728357b53 [Thermothielavioides terrestris]|nr:e7bc8fef-8f9e-4cbb-927b-431728357b53 [Thermothielavioides terrestris]
MLREQPYQVSRLVLDLDAIDCPGVRPYSLQDEIEQRDLWGTNPEMDALFQRMVRVKEEIRVSKMKWQAEVRQYDPKRITERDVLAVAFFGAPHDSDVTGNAQVAAQAPPLGYVTRGLLDSMGVTDRIADDVHHTVHMLLRRLREQPSLTVPSEPFREFADTLGKTEDVALVERIVAPLLQTGWGRAMVSRCRDEIVGACVRANRLVLDDGAWRVYRFLKSLSAGLAANGLKFDLASSAAVRQLEDRLFGQHLGLLRGQHGVLGLQQ